MFMMLEDQYGVGDVIDFQQASGTVEAVGLRTTRLRDVNGTVWYVRNGEVIRVGNKSQGYAQVVLDVPIDAWADVAAASAAIQDEAETMRTEDEWAPKFLGDPDLQGVESMTREETVIRLVVRVRPGAQFGVARELRRRVRRQQRAHRHLGVHGQRQHGEDLATGRAHDGRTDQGAAATVLDDLDETVVARAVDPAARVRGDLRGAGVHVQPGVAGLLLGLADVSDLGVGEGRPGQRVVTAVRLVLAEQVRGQHA